jgi:hypothetical protein
MNDKSAILIPKIEVTPPDSDVVEVRKKPKINPLLIIIPSILFGLVLIYTISGFIFYTKVKSTYTNIKPILIDQKPTNINEIKSAIDTSKTAYVEFENAYNWIGWMKYTPFAGKYVADLGHGIKAVGYMFEAGDLAFTAVDPYLLELGYKDTEITDTAEKSAQERIDFVVNSIPVLIPKFDEISTKLVMAEKELEKINPNDYPEELRGIKLRDKLKAGFDLFRNAANYFSASKPMLEVTPYLLGMDGDRKYLVLFQNDKELRPTGGFLTAYSLMKVNKAKFEPVVSDDIYNLDSKYKPVLPAPQPIVDLIKGPYILSQNIRLRDLNYNPDFKESMDIFTEEAEKVGMKDYDGIIAVDTQLLVNTLDVLGEIGVSGFGNFSTKNEPKCNCPQVVYELESFADVEGPIIWDPVTGKIILRPPNSDNRKRIIGPLMNSVLANALAQPKEKMPDLINAIFKSVMEKHVLFYLFDQKSQKAVEDFGIAGRILEYSGDYIHINDSNLGGRKSNLYVKQEVEQKIEVGSDGLIEKTVTIIYKNPEKHDGWLNSVLPNWVRIYVPSGSKLIEATGLEKQYDEFEELGKTVFSGYFKLRPEGVSKVTFKYSLPFKKGQGDMSMFIQKQPGTDAPLYMISSQKDEQEFLLNSDKEIKIKI